MTKVSEGKGPEAEIDRIFRAKGREIFQDMTQVLIDHGTQGYEVIEVKLKPPKETGVEWICCSLRPPMCWIC